MRDRDPAVSSKTCPACGRKGLRMGIHTMFVRHYYCYCEECGFRTKPTISEMDGTRLWTEAKEAADA